MERASPKTLTFYHKKEVSFKWRTWKLDIISFLILEIAKKSIVVTISLRLGVGCTGSLRLPLTSIYTSSLTQKGSMYPLNITSEPLIIQNNSLITISLKKSKEWDYSTMEIKANKSPIYQLFKKKDYTPHWLKPTTITSSESVI